MDFLRLYRAQTMAQSCGALTELMVKNINLTAYMVSFAPNTFAQQMYVYPPTRRIESIANLYLKKHYIHDIWLKRSPINPKVRVVRHSDYTDLRTLKASPYYRLCLRPINSAFGASLVAWHRSEWLATITIHRSIKQGDFSHQDLVVLRELQSHFSHVTRRLSIHHQNEMYRESIHLFINNLPTAFILLNWALKVIHHNRAAQWRVLEIAHGPEQKFKPPRALSLPKEIMDRLQEFKTRITEARGLKVVVEHEFASPQEPSLRYRISFVAARNSFNPGLFLVTLSKKEVFTDFAELTVLSRAEQIVFELINKGYSNENIARLLKKQLSTVKNQIDNIYKKLGINSRYELMHMFR